MKIRVGLILVLGAVASCVGIVPHKPPSQEIFDEENASTLLVVAKPMVFARERSDLAAHARDYATLVTVEIDRSGDYSEYLLVYRWSTVDKRMLGTPDPDAGKLRIVADGRVLEFSPLDKLPVNFAQRRELHVPKHDDVVPRGYKIDPATLNFIADSSDIIVRMPQDPFDAPFTLWDDGRRALKQFMQRASAPAP